jgi:hypothetical protein
MLMLPAVLSSLWIMEGLPYAYTHTVVLLVLDDSLSLLGKQVAMGADVTR